jgi:putative nucleotidyltransferase with HDIG domain
MKPRIEMQIRAERIALHIRWVLLAGAGILLSDKFASLLVPGSLACLALVNAGLYRVLRNEKAYSRWGARLLELIRFGEGATLMLVGFHPFFRVDKLYLLALAAVYTQSLANKRARSLLGLSIVMVGALLLAYGMWGGRLQDYAMGLLAVALSALVSFVLLGFRLRDEHLAEQERRLGAVLQCASALASSRNLEETLLLVLKSAVVQTGASCGYLMLTEEDGNGTPSPEAGRWLNTEAVYSMEGSVEFPSRLAVGEGLSGYVAKMAQPVMVTAGKKEHQDFDGIQAGITSAASVPLLSQSFAELGSAGDRTVLGVLTVFSQSPGHLFTANDVDFLQSLAALLAVTVANARMERRRRRTFLSTMESLAKSLEARDEYTRGHSERVCQVSLRIGERMGLSPEALEEMRVGTLLHDIGKIGVRDAILNKPGKLTDEEFEQMKQHTLIGYEICRPLNLSEGVLMLIRNHHERLDGTGYPDGLKGGELPLSLRIVCVADAFDAMSSRRPYRGVMSHQAIMSELSRNAGIQFDPVIVETLKQLIAEGALEDLYQDFWTRGQRAAA